MVFQGMVTLPHYSAAAATLRFALTHMNQIFTDTKIKSQNIFVTLQLPNGLKTIDLRDFL